MKTVGYVLQTCALLSAAVCAIGHDMHIRGNVLGRRLNTILPIPAENVFTFPTGKKKSRFQNEIPLKNTSFTDIFTYALFFNLRL